MAANTTENDKGDQRWLKLFTRKLEVETIEAFKFFRARNIEPLLIKGWASARRYPPDDLRFYVDIDLAVAADQYEQARQLLNSEEGSRIAVDLHCGLRHLDTKPWDLTVEDSELVELDGEMLRVPCQEDHLRIMAVHWLNDGGERKDRLWDIYYAVSNRPRSFSWEKCLDAVSETRRRWVIAAIGLTHKYLGLCLDGLPFRDEALDLPEWLTRTVESEWKSGVRRRSLHTCLNDPAELVRQLRKRVPPNALNATIEMEGDILNGRRLPYQLRCMKKQATPSIQRVKEAIASRLRK